MNAAIHQKVKVPEGCMIGMGAVITKRTVLKSNSKYAGVPAKFIGSNDRIS
jgi:carbonic anhydrase/acetyltransferase-like protein (isoleucine patch superfamily)